MRHIELIQNNYFDRGNIYKDTDLVEFLNSPCIPFECYTSMYNYKQDVIEYIESGFELTGKKSLDGYVGEVNSSYLWLDIDTDTKGKEDAKSNILATIDSTREIIVNLEIKYGIKPNNLEIYFSGFKGFHIGIRSDIFGAENYWSESLPMVTKLMVKELTDNHKFIDTVIYNTTRIFRVPRSFNKKSGLYKILIPYSLIETGNVEEILGRASACYSVVDYPIIYEKKQSLVDLFKKCISVAHKNINLFSGLGELKNTKKIDSKGEIVADSERNRTLFHIPTKGGRNNAIQKMCVRLMDSSLKTNEVIDLVHLIAEATNLKTVPNGADALTDQEIRLMLNSAFKKIRTKKAEVEPPSDFTKDFSVLVESALTSQYVPTFIPEIDKDLGGGLMQKNVYNFIGVGGSMKSIITMWIALQSAYNGIPGVYFNSEMSYAEFLNRIIMMITGVDIKSNLKEGFMNESQANTLVQQYLEALKGKLFIVNDTYLSVDSMGEKISEIESTYNIKLAYCFLDSFSTLDTGGLTETQGGIVNSLALKELAKEKNIAIGVINHCNGTADRSLKDTSTAVRGGPKIIDNGDAYFCLSQIVDEAASTRSSFPPDIRYIKGLRYIRFVNKRGSGSTIDNMFLLDTASLRPKYLNEDERRQVALANVPRQV